jgi:hypothetical protein
MRPVLRSTSNQAPRCHSQRAEDPVGIESVTRHARRTTNTRSVTSCVVPAMYS